MITAAQISDFLVSYHCALPAFPGTGWAEAIAPTTAVNFASIANFSVQQGTYTPNNDYLYLLQNLTGPVSPNFLILTVSSQATITIGNGNIGYLVDAVPVFKTFCLLMPGALTNPINYMYFEGRTNVPYLPMPQNVPVDYVLISGQATLS